MPSSSQDSSEQPPDAMILRGRDWDLIMTPIGSGIASGDGPAIPLQTMN